LHVSVGALVLVSALSGCARSFESVTELPKTSRKPDGVVLDRPVTLPESDERGRTADRVVALREPFETRAIEELIKAYFHGWEHEDAEAIGRLLTDDAVLLKRPGAGVVDAIRTRMRTYEYQRLAGLEVARFDRLERFAYADLEGSATRPAEMREGDLLVRVPLLVARVGGDPLFGDSLVLLLRRQDGAARIAGIAEESGSN
jgi:hypothetical protein